MAQQPINVGTGVETGDGEISRTAWIKVNANFTDVYTQIATVANNLGTLGGAAALNVGVTVGTVADGGALTAETSRATAAENANASAISTETTRAKAAEAALQAAIGQGTTVYAVNYTAQSLTAPQQLQARQNIAALASGDATVLGNGSAATTQAAGDNTTKVATDAFVTGAITSFATTVSQTYAPLASPTFTGNPLAPTQAAGDNSTKLATTAYSDRSATLAMPPGAVAHFAMASAPAGWLKANGAAISRTLYPALFAAIGTTFGAGDGSATFNLPDLRGEFLRSLDDSRGVDSSRAIGSSQAQNLPPHQHRMPMGYDTSFMYYTLDGSGNPLFGSSSANDGTGRSLIPNNGGSASGFYRQAFTDSALLNATGELRPRNVALLACIKT